MLTRVQRARLEMGSKIRTGWLISAVLEYSLLLLLLLASPLRPGDFGNMFQYTDPGASFSWPDQMLSDVIAIVNASGNTSTHCDSVRNRSSGYHPLTEDQNLSYFKAMGRNKPCSGSRGNSGTCTACTTVTLSYERSVRTISPDATLGSSSFVELSYVIFGPVNRTMRCFPSQDERKEDVCTIYNPRHRTWFGDSSSVKKQVKVVIDTAYAMVASNSTLWNALQEVLKTQDEVEVFDVGLPDLQKENLKSLILDCEKFDQRRHSWYRDDIFAKKQHKILIDSGNSMGAPVKAEFNRAPGTSYLNVAQELAAEFLKTLTPKDMVDVFSFNAIGAHPLNSQVKGKFHGAKNSNDLAELPSLSASIANAYIPTSIERSNLSTAILDVIPTFQLDKSSSNVILVFSDGNFESLCLWPKLLAALQIRVMLYILPYNSNPDQYVLSTKPIPALLSEANGYFEILDATSLINPLYWIQSYFSFVAQLDLVLRNSEWSAMYFCVFKETSAVTVRYPVLGNDDTLIGVEGIDVELEDITNELQMLLKHYIKDKVHDKLFKAVLITQFCNHQIDSENDNLSSFATHLDGLFTKELDTSYYQIHDRACYGMCTKTPSNSSSKSPMKFNLKFYFIIIIFIIIFVFIIISIIRWIKQENSVFLTYNRELNALIPNIESNSANIGPSARIIYKNRDSGIVFESPSSRGSSGIVSRVMFFGVESAMKIFHGHAKNDFRIEASTFLKHKHAHIVEFYCAFGDSTIVMELMDNDLFYFIANARDHNKNYNLPLEVAMEIMLQIAEGMSYLHQCGIAHQDLKSLNILLKFQEQIQDYKYKDKFKVTAKVADFGNAQPFDPTNPKGFVLYPNVNIGTRAWRAPELFHQKRSFFARLFGIYPYVMLKPLDIYGFGIICHELIIGQVPMRAGHDGPPSLPLGRCPEGLVTLIEDCCKTNPLQRPEFDKIRQRLSELRSSLAFNE